MGPARTTSILRRTQRVLLRRWQDTSLALSLRSAFGASLLAAAVLPLATSYAVSEAFGFSKGVGLDFRRAPLFFTLFTDLIIFGAAVMPNLSVIKLLVLIQVLNGVLLPIFLVFILLLINDERLTKEAEEYSFLQHTGVCSFAIIALAVAIMLLMQFLGLWGVKLLSP